MKEKPLVSIILPTYNRCYCIKRSIESVLFQSYGNFELIIVDDNSSDDTSIIVSSISDVRIKYIKLKENKGPAGARNEGIKIANGDYIAFQDSDDVWHREKLEKEIQFFEKDNSLGMVFCRYEVKNSPGKFCPAEEILNEADYKYGMFEILLSGNRIGTPTMLIKKNVMKAVGGFDENLVTLEDWDLALRVAREYKIKYLNEVLLDVFVTENSVNTISGFRRLTVYTHILMKYWNLYCDKEIFNNIFYSFILDYLNLVQSEKNEFFDKLIKLQGFDFFLYNNFISFLMKKLFVIQNHREELQLVIDNQEKIIENARMNINQFELVLKNREGVIADKVKHEKDLEGVIADRNKAIFEYSKHDKELEKVIQNQDIVIGDLKLHVKNLELIRADREKQIEDCYKHISNLEAMLKKNITQTCGTEG